MPVIIYGTSLYGRCDQVPGILHFKQKPAVLYVATEFSHIYWLFPVFPGRSYAILTRPGIIESIGLALGGEKPLAAVRIPFSAYSALLGHGRALLIWFIAVAIVVCLFTLGPVFEGNFAAVPSIGFSAAGGLVISILLLWLSYRNRFASRSRQQHLLQLFGIDYENMQESGTTNVESDFDLRSGNVN